MRATEEFRFPRTSLEVSERFPDLDPIQQMDKLLGYIQELVIEVEIRDRRVLRLDNEKLMLTVEHKRQLGDIPALIEDLRNQLEKVLGANKRLARKIKNQAAELAQVKEQRALAQIELCALQEQFAEFFEEVLG